MAVLAEAVHTRWVECVRAYLILCVQYYRAPFCGIRMRNVAADLRALEIIFLVPLHQVLAHSRPSDERRQVQ